MWSCTTDLIIHRPSYFGVLYKHSYNLITSIQMGVILFHLKQYKKLSENHHISLMTAFDTH